MTHPTEQIEAAITGGLTPAEQAAFDEHVAGCPACATLVAEAKAADAAMNELFAGHRPDDDFEERMIQNIRRKQLRITHPLVRRIAVGVAASIVLGGIGYVASPAISSGRVPSYSFGNDRVATRFYAHNVEREMLRDAAGNSVVSTSRASTGKDIVPPTPRPSLNTADMTAADANGRAMTSTLPALSLQSDRPYAVRDLNENDSDVGKLSDFAKQTLTYRYKGDSAATALNRGFLATHNPTSGVEISAGYEKEVDQRYFKVSDGKLGFSSGGGAAGVDEFRRTAGDSKDSWGVPQGGSVGIKSPVFGGSSEHLSAATHLPAVALQLGDKTVATNADERKAMSGKLEALEQSVKRVESDTKGTAPDAKLEEEVTLKHARFKEDPQVAAVIPAPAPDAKPDAQAAAVENPPSPLAVEPARPDVLGRPKIIRTGEMEFEVDSFDSSVGILSKVIAEEQGYISTTNSDKLANGKVKGSVVLRVPAEHLDTLVLKLRGIGDLRSQHVNAQDITKQFTDTESALRAAKAMQERLLDIIKNGKGAVKDLLEAEKQLGTWREKVEQLEGEIRYYSNQVSMSTLTLTLFERDIRQPALASESETVTMALETDKVEDAYAKAKDAIAQAKGRIVNSELKQFDAGQFGGTIVAQVPPDAADAVIGRLKQFDGRVARFERQRNQTTSNGNAPSDGRLSADSVKVKREDVTINLTLYNLANVAPRRTTTLTVVAGDVEKAYHALIDQVRAAGGRVITSQINRAKADQVAGAVNFNVPTEKADELLAALRGSGEVLKTETAESPDTQNVTESKRGFNVTIGSLSAFPARETQQIQLAAVNVPDAFNDLLNALRTGAGRIIASRLNEQDRGNTSATLEFEVGRDVDGTIEKAMAKDGQVITRQLNRSTDTDSTVDSKVHIALTIGSSEQLPPRQSTDLNVEVTDVQKAMDDLQAAALAAGGRQVDNPAISQGDGGQTVATIALDVPLDKVGSLIESADGKGIRKSRRTSIDAHAPEGKLARARLTLTFATPATLTGSNDGALAGIRSGLGTSMRGLSYSLTMIIIGVCLVAPWVLLIGGIWRGVKWVKKTRVTTSAAV